ncbi:MAG: DNA-directed RNA polymerase subunit omega [Armatimonadetes bacterium]|nr:DNA-directed RNA polymerase subunit omega [Armatimonadota bacterium]MDI9584724.1 DNA-directed RNA polymerase subunit omega [Acidobacteriota bacterium]
MDQFPLEEVVAKVGSRFAVVVAAANRAKQIKDGSPPLVEIESNNPLTIALTEIAMGKVIIEAPEHEEDDIHVATLDQYFAGREAAGDDAFSFRRADESRVAAGEDTEEDEDDLDLDDEDLDLDDDLDLEDDLEDDED